MSVRRFFVKTLIVTLFALFLLGCGGSSPSPRNDVSFSMIIDINIFESEYFMRAHIYDQDHNELQDANITVNGRLSQWNEGYFLSVGALLSGAPVDISLEQPLIGALSYRSTIPDKLIGVTCNSAEFANWIARGDSILILSGPVLVDQNVYIKLITYDDSGYVIQESKVFNNQWRGLPIRIEQQIRDMLIGYGDFIEPTYAVLSVGLVNVHNFPGFERGTLFITGPTTDVYGNLPTWLIRSTRRSEEGIPASIKQIDENITVIAYR